jgi:hypothetical protein
MYCYHYNETRVRNQIAMPFPHICTNFSCSYTKLQLAKEEKTSYPLKIVHIYLLHYQGIVKTEMVIYIFVVILDTILFLWELCNLSIIWEEMITVFYQ